MPVVVLAPHRINVDGALLSDGDGTPVAYEGDPVTVVGGMGRGSDSGSPVFQASTLSVHRE